MREVNGDSGCEYDLHHGKYDQERIHEGAWFRLWSRGENALKCERLSKRIDHELRCVAGLVRPLGRECLP